MTKLSERLRVPSLFASHVVNAQRSEAADLLEECERVMTGVAYYSPEAAAMMEDTLDKLRKVSDS